MARFKLAQKLLLGFFSVCAIFVTSAWFVSIEQQSVRQRLSQVEKTVYPALEHAAELEQLLEKTESIFRDAAGDLDPELLEAIEGIASRFSVALMGLEAIVGKDELGGIGTLYSQYVQLGRDAVEQFLLTDDLTLVQEQLWKLNVLAAQLKNHLKKYHRLRYQIFIQMLEQVGDSGERMGRLILVFTVMALVLGGFVALFMTGNITKPITRLVDATRQVGGGDLTAHVELSRGDELGDLALAFNKMTDDLRSVTVSRDYVDNVIRSMVDTMIVSDSKGIIQTANRAALELLGYEEKELLGKPMGLVLEDNPFGPLRLAEWTEGDYLKSVERIYVNKSGKKIPVSFSGSTLRNKKGEVYGIVYMAQDNTERKQAQMRLKQAYDELKQTQQELIQSEKLAALGRFSLGLAHEVKNPLAIILGWTEFLQRKLTQADADTQEALEKIKDSVDRSNRVIHELLLFSRPSQIKRSRLSVEALVVETLGLLEQRLKLNNVAIDVQLEQRDKLWLEVNKNQIQQVLFNLLINAADAVAQQGRIGVKAYPVDSSGRAGGADPLHH